MGKIKIEVPIESPEHKTWRAEIGELTKEAPDKRSDDTWDKIADLEENEPVYGEGSRRFYVPEINSIPASEIQRLPGELFKDSTKTTFKEGYRIVAEILKLYIPASAVEALTIDQLKQIGQTMRTSKMGES